MPLSVGNIKPWFVEQVAVATNTYTYVANATFTLIFAHVTYVSDATVGARWVRMGLLDESAALVMDTHAGVKQNANLTRHYHFMTGASRETAFNDDELIIPFSIGMIVPVNYSLVFSDIAGISPTDSMTVSFQGVYG